MQALWYAAAPPPWPLRPLAWVFGLIVRVRRWAYARGWLRARSVGRPVIVVGNLTVGGSGKTPTVLWLAQQLRAAGYAPGIVLRGYGGAASARGEVCAVESDSDPAEVGDEALLLRRRSGVPVAIGADRERAARRLIGAGVDVVISDDGLQHLALARQCELIIVDGDRGLGNGWLLPAGPLREPARRLESADALIVNGAGPFWRALSSGPDAAAGRRLCVLMQLRGTELMAVDGSRRSLPLEALRGQRVHALAGIGHPERFFTQLRAAGLALIEHVFADHHRFTRADVIFPDALPVLMTEKDAVKCERFAGADCWYLPVVATFDAVEAAQLLGRVRRAIDLPSSRGSGE